MEGTNQSLAYNHLAIIKISNYKSVVASCATFNPPSKVPMGSTYRVLSRNFLISLSILVIIAFLRWVCI